MPSSSWRTRQTTASRSSRSTATTSTRPRRCFSPAPLPRSSRYPNSTAAASAAAPRVRSPAISRGASGPWSLGGTDPLLPRIPEVGSSQLLTGLGLTRILGGPRIPRSGEVTYALAGNRPRQSGLARGRGGGAACAHAGLAVGALVSGCGGPRPRSVVLDALSTGGHLEVVPVQPGGAHPRCRADPAAGGAAGVKSVALADLRRIVAAVARLRGETGRDVTVRSDIRHLKVELESGLILGVSAERGGPRRAPLGGDVVSSAPDGPARP